MVRDMLKGMRITNKVMKSKICINGLNLILEFNVYDFHVLEKDKKNRTSRDVDFIPLYFICLLQFPIQTYTYFAVGNPKLFLHPHCGSRTSPFKSLAKSSFKYRFF